MKSLIISTTLSAHPSSLHSHCHRLSPVSFPVTNSVPIVTGFSTSHNQPSLFRHYQLSSTVLKCRVSTIVSPPAIDDDDKFKFMEAAKKGNLIPLYRCIFSDQLTPVQAYRCLVKEEDDRDAPSFIMESVEQGYENTQVTSVTIMDHIKGIKTEKIVENPMEIPKTLMEEWSPQLLDELPQAFCGGSVGYFSYDEVRYVEKKKLPFSAAPKDDRNLPDISLGLYDDVIIFDHIEKENGVLLEYQLADEGVNQARLAGESLKNVFKENNIPI